VLLRGRVVGSNQVEIVDAATTKVVGHALPEQAAPDIGEIEPQAQFDDKKDEPGGIFDLVIHGGPNTTDKPMAGVQVALVPEGQTDASNATAAATDDAGKAHFQVPPGRYQAQIVIQGRPMTSPAIDLTAHGAALQIGVHWQTIDRLQAMFDVPVVPDQVLYARTYGKNGQDDVHRSPPFQLVPERGTTASVLIGPPLIVQFNMVSEVEDNLLAVQGEWALRNLTWAPYRAGPDGLVVALPKHFKGGIVAERDAQIAAVDADQGFRIMRPLPPERTEFHGFFSMPIENGDVAWTMDLPYGAFQSELRIVSVPSMKVDLPGNAHGETVTARDGTPLYDINPISIEAGHSMQMTVHGLPSIAAWKIWVPRVIGVLVVLMILGGITLALVRGAKPAAAPDPARAARRTRLMDELVELDRTGKDKKRREALVAELEKLWD
jgi:hypothetical protein